MLPQPEPQPSEPQSPAARIFVAYLAELEAGAALDFEDLVRRNPAQEHALRRLQAQYLALKGLHGPRASAEPDPVDPKDQVDSSARFAAEVLQRLSGRSAAFGRYQVRGEIEKGGMGKVLRVWDEDLRRDLAMKFPLPSQASGLAADKPRVHARSLARFFQEAQVGAQLDHPGIMPVYDFGVDSEGQVYFTMKLVDGQTLESIYEQLARGAGGWTQVSVLGLIQRVCEAMAYAHSRGVIHRDLKPRNVMVGRFGEVYVLDWGLAKVLRKEGEPAVDDAPTAVDTDGLAWETQDQQAIALSRSGLGFGTPGYVAPEQREGRHGEVGPHSDVYSVGAMLACLVTGRRPADDPQPVAELAPDQPAELAAICDKAMARDGRARYRDMSELSKDLAAYVENRVVSAYPATPWLEARKWVRRNRSLAWALAASLLILIAGISAYAVKSRRATEQMRLERAGDNLEAAERSAMRGDWHAALKQIAEARTGGFPDEARLLVREAEAWMGLSERERCNEILDRLDRLDVSGELSAKAALLRGDLAMSEWTRSQEANLQLQRARDLGLPPADEAYVDGLLSEDSEGALESFDDALSIDPFHHGAHAAKAMLLTVLGRREAALDAALAMESIFPDDPAPPTVRAVTLASEGRFEEASGICRQIAQKHGPEMSSFSEVCLEAYRAFIYSGTDIWYGGGSEWSPFIALGLAPALKKLAEASDLPAQFVGPNLPSLRQSMSVLIGSLMSAILAPSSVQLMDSLEEAYRHHPDGLIEYMRATQLLNLPREDGVTKLDTMRWAAEAFANAAQSSSFIPGVQRAARFWHVRCLDYIATNFKDPAQYEGIRPKLEAFLDVQPRSEIEDSWMSWISSRAGHHDLARSFAQKWRASAKAEDDQPTRQLAHVELLDGRPAAALELLEPLLVASPSDEQLLELQREALLALETSLGRYR